MTVPASASQVIVDGAQWQDWTRIVTTSALRATVDTAEVVFDNGAGDAPEISLGAPVIIGLGYQGLGIEPAFVGAVTRVERGSLIQIEAKDGARKLSAPVVRQWRNTTPFDIATDLAAAQGMALDMPLADGLRRRSHWVSAGSSAQATLRAVAAAWGIADWALFAEGEDRLYWGPWDQSPRAAAQRTLTFIAARDFTDWTPAPAGAQGRLVMRALPDLAHSHTLLVLDEAFGASPALIRCDRVRHILESRPSSKTQPTYRTEVEWTRLA